MPYLTSNVGAAEWAAFILGKLSHESVLLAAGARKLTFNGRSLHVPVFGTSTPQWLAELEEIDEDDAVPTEVELIPRKVGSLNIASTEGVEDASVDVLDGIGAEAVRSIAGAIDHALFVGTGAANNQPLGLLAATFAPTLPGSTNLAVDYAGIVTAAGAIRAAGGRPDVLFVHPTEHTALTLALDAHDRPLLQETADGPAQIIAGLRVYATPAVPAGTALAAEASQILVGVRDDPRVDISVDAAFSRDGVAVRTTARVDVRVANAGALYTFTDTTP